MTSNLPFSKREAIFRDAMMAGAAIDRLVHHSVIIELSIPSYRVENAKVRRREGWPRCRECPRGHEGRGAVARRHRTHQRAGGGKGSDAYNDHLSVERAEGVKRYIIERYSVAAARIAVEGHGKREPLYPPGPEENDSLNRRVEVRLVPAR